MTVTLIRTAIMYVFVTIGIRVMGKRQIGDMQPNELVVTLLISEIAAIPLQDTTQPLLNGVVAIFTLVIIEIVISLFCLKFIRFRRLMNGRSIVIIKNGVIDEKAMRKVRMTVIDLVELLRDRDVFDLGTVAYAVLEVNGSLSVMLKPEEQPLTPKVAKVKAPKNAMQLPVITDGKIIDESLAALDIDKKDITRKLRSKNYSVNEVFLMTLDRDGNENIVKKGENI